MRKEIHTREVKTRIWILDNGNWEIEARLLDTKGYDAKIWLGKELPAGEALHEMRLDLETTPEGLIESIQIEMPSTPFDVCPKVANNFKALVGEHMGKGWNQLLRERFSDSSGCRHIIDLLRNTATTLYQAMAYTYDLKSSDLPYWSNSCYALQKNGKVIQALEEKLIDTPNRKNSREENSADIT